MKKHRSLTAKWKAYAVLGVPAALLIAIIGIGVLIGAARYTVQGYFKKLSYPKLPESRRRWVFLEVLFVEVP